MGLDKKEGPVISHIMYVRTVFAQAAQDVKRGGTSGPTRPCVRSSWYKTKKEEAGVDFEDAESTIRQPPTHNSSCKPYISGIVQTDYKSDTKLAR